MDKEHARIIKMLAELEHLVGELYGAYAEQFPQHKQFWLGLVKEENTHEKLVKELLAATKKGDVTFNEKECPVIVIEQALDYVRNYLDLTLKHKISLVNALSMAEEIEKNVAWMNFCSYFEGGSGKVKGIPSRIASETQGHLDKIQAFLAANRPKAKGK